MNKFDYHICMKCNKKNALNIFCFICNNYIYCYSCMKVCACKRHFFCTDHIKYSCKYNDTMMNIISNTKYNSKLKPPYCLEEIIVFENKFNISLDNNFKNYLLNISSEIIRYKSHIPCLIFLNITGTCEIPININIYYGYIHEKFCSCIVCENPVRGMIRLDYSDENLAGPFIVIKGNHLGTIWYFSGYDLCKYYNSFEEYINEIIPFHIKNDSNLILGRLGN